jgi:hypothetical protein
VLFSCPICGCGTLKSVSTGKTIYLFDGNGPRDLGKSQAYSCGSNGHIVIETEAVSAAPETKQVLNSWKEIAHHLGRGVRTVQRWEQELEVQKALAPC